MQREPALLDIPRLVNVAEPLFESAMKERAQCLSEGINVMSVLVVRLRRKRSITPAIVSSPRNARPDVARAMAAPTAGTGGSGSQARVGDF
jgi:hypothetical protein